MPAAFQAHHDDDDGGALCRFAARPWRRHGFGITPSFGHRDHWRIDRESTSHVVHDPRYLSCVRSCSKAIWQKRGRRVRVVCEGINILTHQFSEDISKLDDSCISNPKSEISNWTRPHTVQFAISDFGFEMQESCN